MAASSAQYKGWLLVVLEPLGGMAVFFVVAPGPDPPAKWGMRRSHQEAVEAGRKLLVAEANNEQSSRGRS